MHIATIYVGVFMGFITYYIKQFIQAHKLPGEDRSSQQMNEYNLKCMVDKDRPQDHLQLLNVQDIRIRAGLIC